MATVMYAAFFVVVANALVDLLYACARPAGAACLTRQPLLEVRDLRRLLPHRGRRSCAPSTASRFALGAGEVLGIVGESGSGKTVSMLARDAADPRPERGWSRERCSTAGAT